MKKALFLLVTCLLLASPLFAFDNNQKIYRTDCDEYRYMTYLYIDQGLSLPSTTGPWSEAELSDMLAKIDPARLKGGMRSIYEILDRTLNGSETQPGKDRGIKTGFTFDLNLEFYAHTNTDTDVSRDAYSGSDVIKEYPFQGAGNWIYNELEQKPFFGIRWDTYVNSAFYGHFEYELRNSFHSGDNHTTELGCRNFGSNILFLKNFEFDLSLIDGNVPFRAFASVGGDNWNFQIGRDRVNWGAGETGNLTLSDNFLYHNLLRFTAYGETFKYTFLTSFFTHPQNYYTSAGKWDGITQGQGGTQDGIQLYLAHRVEARLFRDKLTLGLTEGIMVQNASGTLDLRVMNPMMFYHNNYIPDVTNSTLAFEADFSPVRHLDIFGQFIIDEIAFPGIETGAGPDERSTPSAYGFMVGAKTSFAINKGVFHASMEVARTDPYLYLRDGKDDADGYDLSYVGAIRQWSTSTTDVTYDEKFLGYTYGPDALAFNVKAGYDISKLRLEGSIFYMLHGTHNQWTTWTRTGGEGEEAWEQKSQTPTSVHESTNRKYNYTMDAVSETLVCGMKVSYQFTSSLSAFAQVDFISITNWANLSTNPVQKDTQVVLGGTWKF